MSFKYKLITFAFVAVVVRFDQSKYSVNENNGSIQAVLVFSGPSSTNVTLGILVVAGTANSK